MFDEQRTLQASRYPVQELIKKVQEDSSTVIQIPAGPYLAVLLEEVAQDRGAFSRGGAE